MHFTLWVLFCPQWFPVQRIKFDYFSLSAHKNSPKICCLNIYIYWIYLFSKHCSCCCCCSHCRHLKLSRFSRVVEFRLVSWLLAAYLWPYFDCCFAGSSQHSQATNHPSIHSPVAVQSVKMHKVCFRHAAASPQTGIRSWGSHVRMDLLFCASFGAAAIFIIIIKCILFGELIECRHQIF